MHSIEGALRMSDEINAQFGFERVFGKTNGNADTDTKITKFGISFNSDGTTTFYAAVKSANPNWKPGQAFDTSILDNVTRESVEATLVQNGNRLVRNSIDVSV